MDLFAGYGAWIEIVYLEDELRAVLKRNAGRKDPVPARVIEKLAGKVEVPDVAEGHQVRFVVLG